MPDAALLLSTKLYIPRARPHESMVSRQRLFARLSEGVERPLTVVSAPAGFGKTTLLSGWISEAKRRVAWLSLEVSDNDPARFLAYIIAAMQTVQDGLGESALSLLRAQQPSLSLDAVLTTLLNEIAASTQEYVLVLDDYHVIESYPIHYALAFLVEHLPATMRLVVASRADPPLPLARLRGQGQLAELRADELRFTREEATAFLNGVMRLNLSVEDIATLEQHTEGWIAGLQLAALSMRGLRDAHGFITAFGGSNRYIVDYLAEEVVDRQPQVVQSFLLQTSLLDRLCAPLCDALTGRSDGQDTLEKLELSNLFVSALDQERRWYRYHRLFADVLRNRLHQAYPDSIAPLHRRASQWYAHNGFIPAAIVPGLAVQEFEQAAEWVEQIAEATFWMRGEIYTLLGWLRALPDAVVHARTRLSLVHAWLLMWTGHLEKAATFLCGDSDLPDTLAAEERRAILGEATAIRAELAHLRGDLPGALELARQATRYLSDVPDSWRTRGISLGILGGVYRVSGDVRAAAEAYAEASRLMQQEDHIVPALVALGYLIQLRAAQGQLRQAAEVFQEAVRLATERRVQTIPTFGLPHISMGEILREWNDLDAALQHAQEGIRLCRQWEGLADDVVDGYLTLARVKQAQGDDAAALDAIREAEQMARAQNLPQKLVQAAATQARLWIMQGDLEAAARWAGELHADVEFTDSHQAQRFAQARVLIAQDNAEAASRLLGRLLPPAEAAGLVGRVIEILSLQALAFHAEANVAQALITLTRALSLAEPEGYVRLFVDEGTPMLALLREAEARGAAPGYIIRLITALGAEASASAPPRIHTPTLLDPLSERELQILRLLAVGLSTREIADELVIAVGTVRTHVKSIYGKLDAHNRVQAVERARALNLL